jgi:hypothetical protein
MLSKSRKPSDLQNRAEKSFSACPPLLACCRAGTEVAQRFVQIDVVPQVAAQGTRQRCKISSPTRKDFFDSIGQTEKNSARVYLFRFALELGHY